MRYWKYLEDRKIVDLIDQGKTPKSVALLVGVSVWVVYKANKRFREKAYDVSRGAFPKTSNKIN